DAALHLFHDDRLGAAMAEALTHHALLDAPPFQGQGLARSDAQLLFACLFGRFSHSNPNSPAFAVVRHVSTSRLGRFPGATFTDMEPVRKRSRREIRARTVSLSGPASRAACITFDRPNAKSNCAEVNVSIMRISATSARCCRAVSSFRLPSGAASAALQTATT